MGKIFNDILKLAVIPYPFLYPLVTPPKAHDRCIKTVHFDEWFGNKILTHIYLRLRHSL